MTQQAMTQETEVRQRRDHTISGIFGGMVLLLLGTFLLLANQGVITWDRWWQYFIVGLGGVFIIEWLVRYLVGERPVRNGRLIAGVILVGVGAIFLTGITVMWPAILIVVGLIVLASSILRNRK